jgi:16S rRNA (uracil1498-N3)-methyltransferase
MRHFYDSNINDSMSAFTLSEAESKHIIRVLRMSEGDELILLNGFGDIFTCTISDPHPKRCTLKINTVEKEQEPTHSIHIAISPTKQSDRMEWFIEKATEIGVTEISLINGKNQERSKVKIDRLLKRAISAMKQSHRTFLPIINEALDLASFVKKNPNGLLAHCYDDPRGSFEELYRINDCPILIGPEGDFTKSEIELALENGYKTITLGENRLRTETAGLYVCMRAKLLVE